MIVKDNLLHHDRSIESENNSGWKRPQWVSYPNDIPRILDYDLNLGEKKLLFIHESLQELAGPKRFSDSAFLCSNEGLGPLDTHFLRSNCNPTSSVHLKCKEIICI